MLRNVTSFLFTILALSAVLVNSAARAQAPAAPPPPKPGGPAPVASPEGASWSLDSASHDFGTTWAGTMMTHTFIVTNKGNDVLKILEAKPRCACSVSEDYTREIPPGGQGNIPFKLNTALKSGQVSESLVIKTSDPVQPYMTIEMRGFVKTICKLEVIDDSVAKPGTTEFANIRNTAANFGRVKTDQKVWRKIRMENTSGQPLDLKLQGINQPTPRFKAELKEIKPRELFELSVTGEPPFPSGYTNGMISFTTGIAEQSEFQVGIYAYVPPRIEVMPPRMVVNPKYPIQTMRSLKVNNNGDRHFEISSISCSNPDFVLILRAPLPGTPKTREIQVKLPLGQYQPPRYGDIIRIETTDPEQPVIDVYVLPELNMEPEPRPEGQPLVFHAGRMN